MEQNNFEKELQRKLNELKIDPPETVWQGVAERIRKKERKRAIPYLFLLAGVLLLSGAYWFFTREHIATEPGVALHTPVTANDPAAQPAPDYTKASDGKEKEEIKHHPDGQQAQVIKRKELPAGNKGSSSSAPRTRSPHQPVAFAGRHRPDGVAHVQANDHTFSAGKIAMDTATDPMQYIEKKEVQADHTEDAAISLRDEVIKETVPAPSVAESRKDSVPFETNMTRKKDARKNTRPAWTTGAWLSGGISSFISTPSFEKSFSDVSSAPAVGNGSGSVVTYPPSPFKSSAGFSAGIFAEKNIARRIKISAGLSYAYYSVVNDVGQRIQPGTSQYYLNDRSMYYNAYNAPVSQSLRYRNNFHFIELPVSVAFRLSKSDHLPVDLELGGYASKLVATNALQYMYAQSVYYRDPSFFNKMQLGLHSGVSFTLFANRKVPLRFGPYADFTISQLAGKGLYKGQHLSYAGIKAGILFPKK